jgi:hypothetical protein
VPTLQLTTEEQIEVIRPILELQKTRRIGCFSVANVGVDRQSGETIIELTVIALPWSDATAIAKKARKLSEQADCLRSEKSALADKGENAGMAFKPALPGPHPSHDGQPFPS